MIGFTDEVNFHPRNLPALFRTLNACNADLRFYNWGDKGLKAAFGDYSAYTTLLQPHREALSQLPLGSLRNHRSFGVRLFDVCRFELLHHLMLQPRWYEQALPNDEQAIFDKAARYDRDALLDNLAAASFWLEYWQKNLANGAPASFFVFGNSLSYTRSLVLQSEALGITPLTLEHFFTGHHHYLEPRSAPIQGYNELRLPFRAGNPDPTPVLRALAEMQNKNVVQASYRRDTKTERILILGQVVNDFAALSPNNPCLGTIAFYKELIDVLVENTGSPILFKAHPYERKKTRGAGALTYNELRAYVAMRGYTDRVKIVEDTPLDGLFDNASLCLTLHSQGALEALAAGVPVATFGNPFYAKHGFTRDFTSPSDAASALESGALTSPLNSDEQTRYWMFMNHALELLVHRDETPSEVADRLRNLGIHISVQPARTIPSPRVDWLKRVQKTPFGRKARKLVRDPKRFFTDAFHNAKSRR